MIFSGDGHSALVQMRADLPRLAPRTGTMVEVVVILTRASEVIP